MGEEIEFGGSIVNAVKPEKHKGHGFTDRREENDSLGAYCFAGFTVETKRILLVAHAIQKNSRTSASFYASEYKTE